MCLGNISKDFALKNIKQNKMKWISVRFFVDYNTTDISDIINIHKYLMNKFNKSLLVFYVLVDH